MGLDVGGGGLHSGGVRAFRVKVDEDFVGSITSRDACLPAIIDLDNREPEGGKMTGRERGLLGQLSRIRAAHMIPGAIA